MKSILKGTKRKTLLSVLTIVVLSSCSVNDFFGHQTTQYIAVREVKGKSTLKGTYDVERALSEGVPEEEIARYLAITRNFDVDRYIKAGFTYREIIDYLAKQPKIGGEVKIEWKRHKIVYKVYPDKQDVVYWVETSDGKERSPLSRVGNCIVADSDNWEGEMDYGSWPWPRRVEIINGKSKFDGLELTKVGWWKWNFDKENFQGSVIISTTWFVWNNHLVWILSGIGVLLIILYGWHSDTEDKKRKRQEARQAKEE
jgi:hypothetical protein